MWGVWGVWGDWGVGGTLDAGVGCWTGDVPEPPAGTWQETPVAIW